MTEAPTADVATTRRRSIRRDDGIIYKGMAGTVFAFVASMAVLRFTLRAENGTFPILFFLAMLLFDIGWDLAVRASGYGEMLASTATSAIFAKALRRWAYFGAVTMAITYAEQNSSHLAYVAFCLVAWCAADVLTRRAER